MPGAIPKNTRSANGLELLARFLLRKIAVAAPIAREEDVGADLYCNLETNSSAYTANFEDAFIVQVKSPGAALKYGGKKDKRSKWRDYEIKWLFKNGLPLFLGIADELKGEVHLYSMINVWWAYNYSDPLPFEIVCTVQPSSSTMVNIGNPLNPQGVKAGKGEHDCFLRTVDLGPPVATLSLAMSDKSKARASSIVRECILFQRICVSGCRMKSALRIWYWLNDVRTGHSVKHAFYSYAPTGAGSHMPLSDPAEIVPLLVRAWQCKRANNMEVVNAIRILLMNSPASSMSQFGDIVKQIGWSTKVDGTLA